eukprot:m51a1_g13063 hypothetical protein (818) ;mRNA; f:129-2831
MCRAAPPPQTSSAKLSLESFSVVDCGAEGISLSNANAAQLRGVRSNRNTYGLRSYRTATLVVAGSEFANNTQWGLYDESVYTVNATISASNFTKNRVQFYPSWYCGTKRLVVEGCTFSRVADGAPLALGLCFNSASSVSVQGNTWADNNAASSALLSLPFSDASNQVTFAGNTFVRNRGTYITYIEAGSGNAGSFKVTRNTYTANTATTAPATTLFVSTGTDCLAVHENFLDNAANAYELYVHSPRDPARPAINATLNWWGRTTEEGVTSRILDNSDVGSLHRADYWPFLGSANVADVAWNAPRLSFLRPGSIISGSLRSALTLNASASPYYVVATAVVESGATLTIDAGVVLVMSSSASLNVAGTLRALGSAGKPIVIRANATGSTGTGLWGGLYFTDSAVGASYTGASQYLSGSILRNVRVSNGGWSAQPCILIDGAVPYLEDVSVQYCAADGIAVTTAQASAAAVLRRVNVSNCAAYGVRVVPSGNAYVTAGTFVVEGGNWASNVNNAITNWNVTTVSGLSVASSGTMQISWANMHIEGCSFAANMRLDIGSTRNGATTTISGNTFSQSVINMNVNYISNAATAVVGNTFTGSTSTGYPAIYISQPSYSGQITVSGNRVVGFSTGHTYVVYVNAPYAATSVRVFNNTVVRSSSYYHIVNIGHPAAYDFNRNVLVNNTYSYNYACTTCSTALMSGGPGNYFENVFDNPRMSYEVYVDVADVEGVKVNATHCYWGTTAPSAIAQRIFDKADKTTTMEVAFAPFLNSADFADVSHASLPLLGANCTINAVTIAANEAASSSTAGASSSAAQGTAVSR